MSKESNPVSERIYATPFGVHLGKVSINEENSKATLEGIEEEDITKDVLAALITYSVLSDKSSINFGGHTIIITERNFD